MTELAGRRHLRIAHEDEVPPPRPVLGSFHPLFGWQSARYPRTNNDPHTIKLLRYPPNGNVDEWVDHGPDGAPTEEDGTS